MGDFIFILRGKLATSHVATKSMPPSCTLASLMSEAPSRRTRGPPRAFSPGHGVSTPGRPWRLASRGRSARLRCQLGPQALLPPWGRRPPRSRIPMRRTARASPARATGERSNASWASCRNLVSLSLGAASSERMHVSTLMHPACPGQVRAKRRAFGSNRWPAWLALLEYLRIDAKIFRRPGARSGRRTVPRAESCEGEPGVPAPASLLPHREA